MTAASLSAPVRTNTSIVDLAYRAVRRLTKLEIGQVLTLDLISLAPPPQPPLELKYRFLNRDDLLAASANPENELEPSIARRLTSGRDFCYAAFHGDRLANYAWYAVETIEPEHSFGAGFSMPRDTVYMYKALTLPEFRGKQIHGAALLRAADHFRQCGATKMVAIVDFANASSMRSHAKLGFKPVGRLFMIGGKSIGRGCEELLRT